jgi:hypothetical protein
MFEGTADFVAVTAVHAVYLAGLFALPSKEATGNKPKANANANAKTKAKTKVRESRGRGVHLITGGNESNESNGEQREQRRATRCIKSKNTIDTTNKKKFNFFLLYYRSLCDSVFCRLCYLSILIYNILYNILRTKY